MNQEINSEIRDFQIRETVLERLLKEDYLDDETREMLENDLDAVRDNIAALNDELTKGGV